MKDRRYKRKQNNGNTLVRELYCNEEKILGVLVYKTLGERFEQVVSLEKKHRADQALKQKNQINRHLEYSRNKKS